MRIVYIVILYSIETLDFIKSNLSSCFVFIRSLLQIDGPYNESFYEKLLDLSTEDDGTVAYALSKVLLFNRGGKPPFYFHARLMKTRETFCCKQFLIYCIFKWYFLLCFSSDVIYLLQYCFYVQRLEQGFLLQCPLYVLGVDVAVFCKVARKDGIK